MIMNKHLVVLGGGESGVGAAVLGLRKGFDVLLSDAGTLKPHYKELLQHYGVPFEEGGHTAQRVLEADLIVKSPGIPGTAPLVAAAVEKGIPVVSEIEFAGRYTDAKMVCITGSNGKTTTTMLTQHVLAQAGIDASLAGNVGKSLALQVAVEPHDCYVVELSSFQLDNMYDFRADVAVLLNITPDHLDRYDHKMENYIAAKLRVMRNQRAEDAMIYWADDPILAERVPAEGSPARMLPFSDRATDGMAAYVAGGSLHFEDDAWTIALDQLPIKGLHNAYNAMAAGLVARQMGLEPEVICRGLRSFHAVEHRLEHVRLLDGVNWINDSKATNVASTWYALESMTTPVVLILGGKDKGNDYSEIERFVRDKVHAIVCLGVDNDKLHRFFDPIVADVVDARSMAECVAQCRRLAHAGDTVLLSPCCASFDLFKSYEDRGAQFKECVNRL